MGTSNQVEGASVSYQNPMGTVTHPGGFAWKPPPELVGQFPNGRKGTCLRRIKLF